MNAKRAPAVGHAFLEGIHGNATIAVVVGILMFLSGVLAVASPLVAGGWLMFIVGIFLVTGGIAQCVLAFKAGAFGRGIVNFLVGALTVIAGLFMVQQPLAALVVATLFLAAYLICAGLIEAVTAFSVRPAGGWGWLLANGVVSLLLGILLWRQFPVSGVWAIGILLGLKLMTGGATLLGLGLAARRGVKQALASS